MAVFEEYDMLHFTLARLQGAEDEELSAGCPMTTGTSNAEKPEVDIDMEKVGNALLSIVENQKQRQLSQEKRELSKEKQGLRQELRLLAKEMATCTDPEVTAMLREQYCAIKEEL